MCLASSAWDFDRFRRLYAAPDSLTHCQHKKELYFADCVDHRGAGSIIYFGFVKIFLSDAAARNFGLGRRKNYAEMILTGFMSVFTVKTIMLIVAE